MRSNGARHSRRPTQHCCKSTKSTLRCTITTTTTTAAPSPPPPLLHHHHRHRHHHHCTTSIFAAGLGVQARTPGRATTAAARRAALLPQGLRRGALRGGVPGTLAAAAARLLLRRRRRRRAKLPRLAGEKARDELLPPAPARPRARAPARPRALAAAATAAAAAPAARPAPLRPSAALQQQLLPAGGRVAPVYMLQICVVGLVYLHYCIARPTSRKKGGLSIVTLTGAIIKPAASASRSPKYK